jgi:Uma2 family endonuclease
MDSHAVPPGLLTIAEYLALEETSEDRRERLTVYGGILTPRACLLVDQDSQHAERYVRDGDGGWKRTDHIGGGSVPLPCPEIRLSLGDTYRGL